MYTALIAALNTAALNAQAASLTAPTQLERVRLTRLSEVLSAEAHSLSRAA